MSRDVEIDIIANDHTDRGIRSARRNFDKLEKDTAKATKAFATVGSDFVGIFGNTASKAIAAAGPEVQAAIGAVIIGGTVAAAPFIGASISAAIIGGAGIGGVLGGVLLASRDARVKSAASNLGSYISDGLDKVGGVFLQPTLDALNTLKGTFDRILPTIGNTLRNASRFVAPLTQGVSIFVEKVTAGFDKLVANAGPVINEIKNGLAAVGTAIGDMFGTLSTNGASAAIALRVAFAGVVGVIRTVTVTVDLLTKAFGFLASAGLLGPDIKNQYLAYAATQEAAKQSTQQLTSSTALLTGALDEQAVSVDELRDQQNQLLSENNSLFSSETQAAEAYANTTKAIRENGKSLDASTTKGRANRSAVSDLAQAYNTQYDSTVKVYGAGEKANQVASANYNAFVRLITPLAGSASKARALANELLHVPEKTNTTAYANTGTAQKLVYSYRQILNGIPRTITTTVYTVQDGRERVNASGHRVGGYSAAPEMFSAVDGNATRRTGGPNQINSPIHNDITVLVDGSPMRAEIRESQRAMRHKAVGRRYAYGN